MCIQHLERCTSAAGPNGLTGRIWKTWLIQLDGKDLVWRPTQDRLFYMCKHKIDHYAVSAMGCRIWMHVNGLFIQAAVSFPANMNWSTWGLMCCVWLPLNTSLSCILLPDVLRKLLNAAAPASSAPRILYKHRNRMSPSSILLPTRNHTGKRTPCREISY